MLKSPNERLRLQHRSEPKFSISSPQKNHLGSTPDVFKYFGRPSHHISTPSICRKQSFISNSVVQKPNATIFSPKARMKQLKLLDSVKEDDVSQQDSLNIKSWGIIGNFKDVVIEDEKEPTSVESSEKINRLFRQSSSLQTYKKNDQFNSLEQTTELFQNSIQSMIGRGSKEIQHAQTKLTKNKIGQNLQKIRLKGQLKGICMQDIMRAKHPTKTGNLILTSEKAIGSEKENQRYFDELLTSHYMKGVQQMIIGDKAKISRMNATNSTLCVKSPTSSIKRQHELRGSAPVSPLRKLLRKPTGVTSANTSNHFNFEEDNNIDDSDSFIEQNKLVNDHIKQTSKNDFNKVLKQFGKYQNYSELYQQNQNVYMKMINASMNDSVLPKKLQVIQNSDQITQVNVSRSLSQKSNLNKLFSTGLTSPQSQSIKSINMGQNNMTDISAIIQSLPISIQQLNLSGNHLNSNSIIILSQYLKSSQIKNLNLEHNNFGDQGCCILMNSIIENRNLVILNLSKNQLSSLCCDSLGKVIKKNSYLCELYLHYNNINQAGGAIIFKSLLKNTSIKVLDLSFNSLGNQNNFAQRTGIFLLMTPKQKNLSNVSDCCQSLIKILSKCTDLVHLDLSHNQFSNLETQEISKAILKNQTLYGFHFEGNDQQYILDFRGYLRLIEISLEKDIIQIPQLSLKSQQIQLDEYTKHEARNKQYEPMFVNIKDDTGAIKQQHRLRRIDGVAPSMHHWQYRSQKYLDTCWICEGWQEIKFCWTPGISGELAMEPLFVHVNINDYKPILMTCVGREFFLYMMCPPCAKIQYFYSNPIMGIETVAKDQLVNELDEDDEIDTKLLDLLYNGKILVKSPQIRQMNYIFTDGVKKVIDDLKYYSATVISKPREEMQDFDFTPYIHSYVPKWCLEASIFNNYSADNQQSINECFEFDFNSSKIGRLVKDMEYDQVKETLRQIYPLLFHSYKFYASSGNMAILPCLSQLSLNEFISHTTIMDGRIRSTDIEVSFISCNGKDIKYQQVYERALVRYQFMEIFVRIAQDKYYKTGLCKTFNQSITKMFDEDNVKKWLEQFDSSQLWRDERLWNQECDIVLRRRLPFLKLIFKYTCRLNQKTKFYKNLWASAKDFRDMLNQASLIFENFSERDCYLAYLLSMMTQVDELFTPRHYQMNFYEFLEAIARVSEKISFVVPKGLDGSNISDLQTRRELPLNEKLEGLILFLYYRLGESVRKEFQTQSDEDMLEMDICVLGTKKAKVRQMSLLNNLPAITKRIPRNNTQDRNTPLNSPHDSSSSSDSDESFQEDIPNTMDMQTQEFLLLRQIKQAPNPSISSQSSQIGSKRPTIKGIGRKESLASTFSLVSVVAYLRQKQKQNLQRELNELEQSMEPESKNSRNTEQSENLASYESD